MLQKGPVLEIENGVFVYSGIGLDFVNDSSLILNVTGQSSLSSKILIDNDSYLFDLSRNPVYTHLSNLTVHDGKRVIRLQSNERTTGIHHFSSLRVSRYSEYSISNNSIDMPYFRVESCIFMGMILKQPLESVYQDAQQVVIFLIVYSPTMFMKSNSLFQMMGI
ncbi:TPA: hypothetical protein ACGR1M_004582 [Escherichia coli]|uniref:hypothetical protein n=1 Tax=Escherichia coli TaxID=562 RepID=UPI0017D9F92B|nr:hypothetical protein [Escherichia coli]EFF3010919.1 hypothetical protein [Escherichia coli]EFH8105663.1 hypothetical protein [Escherichia coli]EGO3601209.1 hypothetical protein [Escherichia coli]ELK0704529.1 hypothetical protein [Escherichia coli]MCV8854812.1 hypothetical protein [Escherichia coli]